MKVKPRTVHNFSAAGEHEISFFKYFFKVISGPEYFEPSLVKKKKKAKKSYENNVFPDKLVRLLRNGGKSWKYLGLRQFASRFQPSQKGQRKSSYLSRDRKVLFLRACTWHASLFICTCAPTRPAA